MTKIEGESAALEIMKLEAQLAQARFEIKWLREALSRELAGEEITQNWSDGMK